jgi:hypothetical protein
VGLSDPDLQQKLADTSLDSQAKTEYLAECLERSVSLKREKVKAIDPADFIDKFRSFADGLYRSGTADGLSGFAAGCGLTSRRGTNRYRYAPTDDLLRALVLANVTSPIEEAMLLRLLKERYQLVIGPVEAVATLRDSDFEHGAFQKNRERLTQHLIGMGLANRMSDSCTYVINPMESRR